MNSLTAPQPDGRNDTARFRFKAYRFGRLIITWMIAPHGSPMIDKATTFDRDGFRYSGRSILLKPWRRDKWKDALPQPALVVGWRKAAP